MIHVVLLIFGVLIMLGIVMFFVNNDITKRWSKDVVEDFTRLDFKHQMLEKKHDEYVTITDKRIKTLEDKNDIIR